MLVKYPCPDNVDTRQDVAGQGTACITEIITQQTDKCKRLSLSVEIRLRINKQVKV